MKKSLIFVGMLAIGYANAQEGNVGINTDQPKATLDIQPNATNLAGTTNEGIIAPRLSKTRIANIEASKLTEGTLVYATDEATSPISAYAGTDTKVAKITEKGYYFYNGTEWVKAGANGELWAQRDNAGVIETYLKPADANNDIVSYQGNRKIYNNLGQLGFETNTFNLGTNLLGSKDVPLLNVVSSDVLPNQARLGAGNPYTFDNAYLFSATAGQIKQSHMQTAQNTNAAGTLKSYSGGASLLFTDRDVTGNIDYLSGFNSQVNVNSNINARFMNGLSGNPTIGDFAGSTSPNVGVISGAVLYPSALANSTASNLYGVTAIPIAYKSKNDHIIGFHTITQSGSKFWYDRENGGVYPATTLKSLLGVKSQTDALPNATIDILAASHNISRYYENSNVIHGYGISNHTHFEQGATVKDFSSYETALTVGGNINMDTYAVFKFFKDPTTDVSKFNPKNMFGLWLSDINNGTEFNYAIHTGAGKIRVGDLADTSATADRVVTVDANGVLKTGSAANIPAVQVGSTTSMTCDDANRGKMNFVKDVDLGGGKTADAFAVCLKGSDGKHYWRYLYGAGGVTNLQGDFGTGLQ